MLLDHPFPIWHINSLTIFKHGSCILNSQELLCFDPFLPSLLSSSADCCLHSIVYHPPLLCLHPNWMLCGLRCFCRPLLPPSIPSGVGSSYRLFTCGQSQRWYWPTQQLNCRCRHHACSGSICDGVGGVRWWLDDYFEAADHSWGGWGSIFGEKMARKERWVRIWHYGNGPVD